eukprot:Gb_29454 [translate_table: standard]
MALLHQRQQQQPSVNSLPILAPSLSTHHRSLSIFSPTTLIVLLVLIVILGIFFPWAGLPTALFSTTSGSQLKWRDYTLAQAVKAVAKNGTVIVCAVSQPYLPFLNNWLISISKQKRQEQVLVIAEDYATLYKVNHKWPGHAVLIPPAPDLQTAHRFGSQGFFNFTSRRPRHLLQILELGYQVMYNDVDMVWLADPFPFFKGHYDIYFTDDMTMVNFCFKLQQDSKHGMQESGQIRSHFNDALTLQPKETCRKLSDGSQSKILKSKSTIQ